MPVTAIVPLKALDGAKRRLAGHLDDGQRRELVVWMLGRVLDACLGSSFVDRVLVVAGDRAGAEAAARPGVEAVVETTPGLAAALGFADRMTRDAPATLIVPADVPMATAADVDAVCSVDAAVVVVATRDGGTGALLRRPPGVVPTAFGPESAAAHLRLAADAGVRAVQLDLPNLALDVDTPGALRAVAGGPERRTE